MNIDIIKTIHKTPYKFFIAVAGGGQSFIGDFCTISGASNNLIGALVPYNQQIFDGFIGGTPDQYVSSEAARKLAVASYLKCLSVGVTPSDAIGLGVSSSIVKDNERVGRKHKSFIAVHTSSRTYVLELIMNQGRTREQEEAIIVEAIFNTLAYACNVLLLPTSIASIITKVDDYHLYLNNNPMYANLLSGLAEYYASGFTLTALSQITVFGGSFNPFHISHQYMQETAQHLLQDKCILEVSVLNADKGMLDFLEIGYRVQNIAKFPYLLTNKPTLKEKIDLFKKANPQMKINFVLGVDTWNRIWNPKYGYEIDFLASFFRKNDVKFLLFTRNGVEPVAACGQDLIINTIQNPYGHVSSTQLRKEKIAREQK